MNYQRLLTNLDRYGRRTNYAYVCDSYAPHFRQLPRYQQWKRLRNRVALKAMTTDERRVLGIMLAFRALSMQATA